MEELESAPATKEQSLGSRLAVLKESVENDLNELFIGYKLRGASVAKLVKVNRSGRETQIDQQEKDRQKENDDLALRIETGIQAVVSLRAAADHREKEGSAIEPVAQLLNTTDLPPLNTNQTRIIHKTLSFLPDLQPEQHIKVELATELGFEEVELEALQPIAEKLGHSFFRDGLPNFQMLSDPKEQFFLATLAGLVKTYDTGKEPFPVSRFAVLPVDDMKVLHSRFREELETHHPHLHVGAHFKGDNLRVVAEEVLPFPNPLTPPGPSPSTAKPSKSTPTVRSISRIYPPPTTSVLVVPVLLPIA